MSVSMSLLRGQNRVTVDTLNTVKQAQTVWRCVSSLVGLLEPTAIFYFVVFVLSAFAVWL